MLAFSLGVSGLGTAAAPTETIESNLGLQDIEFKTQGVYRMSVRKDGIIAVGASDNLAAVGKIEFANPDPITGSVDENVTGKIEGSLTDGSVYFGVPFDPASAVTAPAGTRLALNANGTNNLSGGLKIAPLAGAAPGNVPYGCLVDSVNSGVGTASATCPVGEVLTGGGGYCINSPLLSSVPPVLVANTWFVKCSDPTDFAFANALCCKQ
jgi:hypothetical protein